MASPPFKVKAVYEYTSPHEDDLHFPNGQIITVTDEEDDDWYSGEYVDASGELQQGIFPKNFVEKYEPTAPPRPTRTSRPKKEPEPAPAPVVAPEQAREVEPEPEPEPKEVHEVLPVREPPPPSPKAQEPPSQPANHSEPSPPLAAKPPPAAAKPSSPPAVSEKPSGGSFRDRIAAFNKAAPPPAPFKPSGLGASSGGASYLVRKPFVAPPPSKNAYVPVAREPPPQKIYRREEDPEIAAQETENQEQAERSGLAATSNANDEEEQPKPTSLKERIALLQKQQMEQAARHAEAAQKKEKPKKPVKKHIEAPTHTENNEEGDGAVLERTGTQETVGKASMDSTREENQPRRRKLSRGASSVTGAHPRTSLGDGNEADMSGAGETTEEPEDMSNGKDESEEKPRSKPPPTPARAPGAPAREPEVGEEEGATEEEAPQAEEDEDEDEEEEEEDDIDPEVRRREELRARMAKMSGGMGMHGMFGPPGGMPMPGMAPPKKKKTTSASEKRSGEYGAEDIPSPSSRAPPVPMIPLPGLSQVKSPTEEEPADNTPISATRPADEVPDVEDVVPQEEAAPPPPVPSRDAAPPIPGGRPAPPPVPMDSRPSAPMSPGAGSESDDEMSAEPTKSSPSNPPAEPPRPPQIPEGPKSPKSPTKRTSYFGSEGSPTSPTASGVTNKRASRLPPPIPGAAPTIPPQNRAPPPPPPGTISRSSTGDQRPQPPPIPPPVAPAEQDEEVTEYEGDYDTDMASTAPPKDSLKSHARDSSLDDDLPMTNSPVTSPLSGPPPLPPPVAPRAVPPPLPSQPPPNSRRSGDAPRGAPPPPPPNKAPAPWEQDEDEYDPYKYSAPKQSAPSAPSSAAPTPRIERNEDDIYSASPPRLPPPSQNRAPPPPPREEPNSGGRAPPRRSLDVSRSATASRKSTELGRMSMDSGYIANDVDLGSKSFWWTQNKGVPPVFQGRKDVLIQFEESTSSDNGKSITTKEVLVLFQDYSQTIVSAEFDTQNPADIQLSQRQEPPPSRVRQDHLEQAHESFGRRIIDAVHSKKETVVGDGTPQGLITELLRPLPKALRPVGTRAYGALVYANIANASTIQNDEIRPGDIITLRNTRFQGKHGPMHAKYSVEIGKPDHVSVVAEWDGTKKKIRAWEQGRESKKVRLESYKLDDLRSGEAEIGDNESGAEQCGRCPEVSPHKLVDIAPHPHQLELHSTTPRTLGFVTSSSAAKMDLLWALETDLARSRCEKLQSPSYLNLALSILILLGILVSYLPQHYRIIARATSEGISPYFILLGTTSGTCAFANILVLPASRADVACCKTVSTFECAAGLLGIAQVGVQWFCFSVILMLFLIFFPRGDTLPEGERKQYTWQTAVTVAFICLLHGLVVIIISAALLISHPTHLGTWANSLGIMATILAAIQYLPQIWMTWHLKHVGSLSIPMMLIQTPGSFVWSGSLAARLGVEGWSTWGVFLVTGCLQGCLLAMGIYFEVQARKEGKHVDGELSNNGAVETDDEGGPVGRVGSGHLDERTPLMNGSRKVSKADRP